MSNINIEINFKKFERKDLPMFLEWAKKPHVKETWFQDGYDPIDKYENKIKGNGYDYCFIIYLNHEPIGYIQTSDLYAYRTLCKSPKGLFTHGSNCISGSKVS